MSPDVLPVNFSVLDRTLFGGIASAFTQSTFRMMTRSLFYWGEMQVEILSARGRNQNVTSRLLSRRNIFFLYIY